MRLSGRAYAAGHDWVNGRLDVRGAGEHRRRLVAEAEGKVLEIGAGTGRNIPRYESATRLVVLEPDSAMLARAERLARGAAMRVDVIRGDAMELPFRDSSFDTVVGSLVMCTIADPRRALMEVRRVLRPQGTFRFYEHVRADHAGVARWQDRLERPWGWIGRGCHPNRDTVTTVENTGFRIVELESFDFRPVPAIVRPHVLGVAARSGEDDQAALC